MDAVVPRHVVCVLGQWSNFVELESIVERDGGVGFRLDREYSQLLPDDRMVRAFEASYDRVSPTMTEQDWKAIETHSAVAYVLSPPLSRETAAEVSGIMLRVTASLLKHGGGLAAKSECAGIAHGRMEWLNLAEKYAQAANALDGFTQGATLYSTWVRRPLDAGHGLIHSCGMHLLGERDIEIDARTDVEDAIGWIDLLGLYLTADRTGRPMLDGEGFRTSETGPRRVIRLVPCTRYEHDDLYFNPYGYVRLVQ